MQLNNLPAYAMPQHWAALCPSAMPVLRRRRLFSKAPFTPSASTNLHTSNEWCQFKLYIGYWTSNKNKWPKCSCQTLPDNTCANDVIDNDVTENDVIDSCIHYLQVGQMWSRRSDATRRARCERGLKLTTMVIMPARYCLRYFRYTYTYTYDADMQLMLFI